MGRRDRSGIRLQSGGFDVEGGETARVSGTGGEGGADFSIAQCQPAAQGKQARESKHRSGARDGTCDLYALLTAGRSRSTIHGALLVT